MVGSISGNNDLLADLIETIYRLRIVRLPTTTTALTLDRSHLGALILSTSASAVTITLPTGTLGNGFLTSIIPLGAGGATLSGTHAGGTTIVQNALANVMTLDDGSWFVVGAS
jgi:hypothetical protein